MDTTASASGRQLLYVKALHTVAWTFFAGCVFAIPVPAPVSHA